MHQCLRISLAAPDAEICEGMDLLAQAAQQVYSAVSVA
jgi:alanine-alpha-ketoisovalerate/valine-pyruvate aminotransferase